MNTKLPVFAITATLLLAACGNKGPLVLPQKPVPVEEPAPAEPATPAPAAAMPAPPPADDPAKDPADPADPASGADDGEG